MPHFKIETNLPRSKIPQDFFSKVESLLAKTTGRSAQYCAASVIPDVMMSFAGSTEPCAMALFLSIECQGVEQNKKHAKAFFELVEKELGVPSDRMYITFQDALSSNVGYTGTTFHDIFG